MEYNEAKSQNALVYFSPFLQGVLMLSFPVATPIGFSQGLNYKLVIRKGASQD
jgi:hypothetical protein